MHVGNWMLFGNMGEFTIAVASSFNGVQRPNIITNVATHEADPESWVPVGSGGAGCWHSVHVLCPGERGGPDPAACVSASINVHMPFL
jgi:ornithine decarboxylase